MSSIKTDDFNQSLSRIFATTNETKQPATTQAKGFQNLLASIENKSSKSHKAVIKQEPSKAPDVITNKHEGEVIPVNKLAPQITKPSYIIGDIPLYEDPPSVKKESFPVKVPIAPVLAIEVPEVPSIVSSKRINLPKGQELGAVMFNKEEIREIVVTAGKYHGIDPSLGLAVAQVESALNPRAVSKDGHASKGVFQLLDSTASDMLAKNGMEESYKPFDPSMNAFLGLGYLRRLHDLFSKDTKLTSTLKTHGTKSSDDLEKIALAAYNAGEGNVARAQAKAIRLGKDPTQFASIEPHLPTITRGYVRRVTKLRNSIESTEETNEIV